MMEPIWKDVSGFEGIYQVSNDGQIKSISRNIFNGKAFYISKERILLQRYNKKGYKVVDLSKNNKHSYHLVHRLVAKAFIPNIKNNPQINHKDGDKTNNNFLNLEWCTNSENQKHAYKLELKITAKNAGRKRKKVQLFDNYNNLIKEFESIAETTRWLKCASNNVKLCCDGKRKKVKGFIAKYKEVM